MSFRKRKEAPEEVRQDHAESKFEAPDAYQIETSSMYDQAGIAFVGCAAKGIRYVARSYSRSDQHQVVTCPEFRDRRSEANHGVFSEAGLVVGNRNVHNAEVQKQIGMEMGCNGCASFVTGAEVVIDVSATEMSDSPDKSAPIALPMA